MSHDLIIKFIQTKNGQSTYEVFNNFLVYLFQKIITIRNRELFIEI
jgi:hypothetical protein